MSAYASMTGLFPPMELAAYPLGNSKSFSFSSSSSSQSSNTAKEEKVEFEVETTPDVQVTVQDARFDAQKFVSDGSGKSRANGSKQRMAQLSRVRKRESSRENQGECENDNHSPHEEAITFEFSVYAHGKNTKVTRSLLDIRNLCQELQKEVSYRRLDPYFRDRPIASIPALPALEGESALFGGAAGGGFTAIRQMMLNYSPKANRWFREVLEVVTLDESPSLKEFLTEPLWEMKLGCNTVHAVESKPSPLGAIEECEDSDEEEEDEG